MAIGLAAGMHQVVKRQRPQRLLAEALNVTGVRQLAGAAVQGAAIEANFSYFSHLRLIITK
jgi:hypothetical protein